ncbi:GNAT family N-acetyltransferase [Burkholderia alba]|uniref:GNAT family N-acetyltransferase n=1 Tax=Burkholderia alba TaxID=2683677 RepID=UPI002B060CA3|nr:GNAT family N-acetyltransferase [Burkholderia alba]
MPVFEPLTLSTPRLILRPLIEADVAPMFEMHSDAAYMRYYSFPAMTRLEQAAERVARLMRASAEGSAFLVALTRRTDGVMFGTCTLFNADEGCRRAEIGFGLHRAHWGQGYMAEALEALIDHAFSSLRLRRLEADIDPRNHASARTLERAGFVREGLLRERWLVDGEVSDTALYGLLPGDRPSAARPAA